MADVGHEGLRFAAPAQRGADDCATLADLTLLLGVYHKLSEKLMRQLGSPAIRSLIGFAALAAFAAPARAGLAEDCLQAPDPDRRIAACSAVIDAGGVPGADLPTAYNSRGNAYGGIGEYRRAIKDFKRALKIDPDDATIYNNRGNAYKSLGRFRRAIDDYDQALKINPRLAAAYFNRGLAYESLGENQRAVVNWEMSIQIGGAAQARWWQTYLTGKGHYSGAIDGRFGPGMRSPLLACARDPDC